ncbi:MAG: S26 family signal peptidase [Phycisphaerae bacterium]
MSKPVTAESKSVARHHREPVKETIESIVVALVLAFVFRAFVVEAFVIPTGSMAPTLYGAHGTILCEDCGTEFAYGLRDLSDNRRTMPIRFNDVAYCPNCKYGNSNLKINDERGNPESGDRILVLKWPLDIGGSLLGPKRWDVTVFKDPADGTTNFIKRLVGLPHEVLMIVDGDVYTAPLADLSQKTLDALDRQRVQKFEFRMGRRRGRMDATPQFVLDELDRWAKIARKTEVAQKSLWQIAYNHDMPPGSAGRSQPRWVPADEVSGWDPAARRMRFRDAGIEGDEIRLQGPAIRATCAYNLGRLGNSPRPDYYLHSDPPFVQDVRVSFVITPITPDGGVAIRLEKVGRRFLASVGFDGTVSIEEIGAGTRNRPALGMHGRVEPMAVGKAVQVSFENLDYRLSLDVDGRRVLTTDDDPQSDRYYGPDLATLRHFKNERTIPAVVGMGGSFDLTHVVVSRDEYYYLDPARHSLGLTWAPRGGWGSADSPILLRGHEHFMLGDNTAASKDSRLWDELGPHLQSRGEACQLGTVPRDQLIGKAFFVYWPSMQRIDWLDWLPMFRRWGVIPDVGRMRWIR